MFSVTQLSTQNIPAQHQFGAWQSLHRDTIELIPTCEPSAGFSAEFSSWRLGEMTLTHVAYCGAPDRQWRHRPKSYLDHWCLVLARTVTADGRRHEDLSFRSLALPFEGRACDSEVITLYMPRSRPAAEEQGLDSAQGLALNQDVVPLLSDYLDSLVRRMPDVSPESAAGLELPTRTLISACILRRPDDREAARIPLASALIERARVVVRQNMASPDFGPDILARLLAMSRSKLYRLFESSGGVSHFINGERLHAAHRRLSSGHAPLSIHAIGNEVGFVDHSTFSRAFRREFGYSPTEARARHPSGSSAPRPDAIVRS